MANHAVNYTINFNGNGVQAMNAVVNATERANSSVSKLKDRLQNFANVGFLVQHVTRAIGAVKGAVDGTVKAYEIQAVAETKLGHLMRQNLDATDAHIKKIKELASAQQALGVIGDEVQLAGAQELSTYISSTEQLEKLIPVMNDMVAQQYGLNASQEAAVTIAQMMGKVLDGQVGALSRYGYSFDEVQAKVLKTGTDMERVSMMAEVITQYVGGTNKALAQTPEGRWKQIANNMGDVQERIGSLVVRLRSGFAPVMDRVVTGMNRWMDSLERSNVIPKITAAIEGLMNVVTTLIKPVTVVLGLTLAYHGAVKAIAFVKGVAAAATAAYTIAVKLLGLTSVASGRSINVLARAVRVYSGGAIAGSVASRILAVAIKGIGTAIYGIPIIGWIAAIIAALIALFKILWEKSRGFRQGLFAAWAVVKAVAHNVGVVIKNIWGVFRDYFVKPFINNIKATIAAFKAAWTWIKDLFVGIGTTIMDVWQAVGDFFGHIWAWMEKTFGGVTGFVKKWIVEPIKNAFNSVWDFIKRIFDKIIEKLTKVFQPIVKLWRRIFSGDFEDVSEAAVKGAMEGGESYDRDHAGENNTTDTGAEMNPPAAPKKAMPTFTGMGEQAAASENSRSGSGSGGGVRNITLTIEAMNFGGFTFHTENLKESKESIRKAVADALLTAVNDVNLAA